MWMRTPSPPSVGPALYKGTFTISDEPRDTFADMEVSHKVAFLLLPSLAGHMTVT